MHVHDLPRVAAEASRRQAAASAGRSAAVAVKLREGELVVGIRRTGRELQRDAHIGEPERSQHQPAHVNELVPGERENRLLSLLVPPEYFRRRRPGDGQLTSERRELVEARGANRERQPTRDHRVGLQQVGLEKDVASNRHPRAHGPMLSRAGQQTPNADGPKDLQASERPARPCRLLGRVARLGRDHLRLPHQYIRTIAQLARPLHESWGVLARLLRPLTQGFGSELAGVQVITNAFDHIGLTAWAANPLLVLEGGPVELEQPETLSTRVAGDRMLPTVPTKKRPLVGREASGPAAIDMGDTRAFGLDSILGGQDLQATLARGLKHVREPPGRALRQRARAARSIDAGRRMTYDSHEGTSASLHPCILGRSAHAAPSGDYLSSRSATTLPEISRRRASGTVPEERLTFSN